jgi:hypothetical protein
MWITFGQKTYPQTYPQKNASYPQYLSTDLSTGFRIKNYIFFAAF